MRLMGFIFEKLIVKLWLAIVSARAMISQIFFLEKTLSALSSRWDGFGLKPGSEWFVTLFICSLGSLSQHCFWMGTELEDPEGVKEILPSHCGYLRCGYPVCMARLEWYGIPHNGNLSGQTLLEGITKAKNNARMIPHRPSVSRTISPNQ